MRPSSRPAIAVPRAMKASGRDAARLLVWCTTAQTGWTTRCHPLSTSPSSTATTLRPHSRSSLRPAPVSTPRCPPGQPADRPGCGAGECQSRRGLRIPHGHGWCDDGCHARLHRDAAAVAGGRAKFAVAWGPHPQGCPRLHGAAGARGGRLRARCSPTAVRGES